MNFYWCIRFICKFLTATANYLAGTIGKIFVEEFWNSFSCVIMLVVYVVVMVVGWMGVGNYRLKEEQVI